MTSPEAELQQRSSGSRNVALDGLRGLAAFTVMFHHFFKMFDLPRPWFVMPLVAGEQAVVLFFILSGFVLSLPYWNKGSLAPYGSYYTRRFFRIWVPLFFARVVALAGDYFCGRGHLPLSGWYYMTWQDQITPRFVLHQLLLGTNSKLNTAFWSLRYELLVSAMFPVLVFLLWKLKPPGSIVLMVVLYVLGTQLHGIDPHDLGLYQETMRYTAMFALGALMAQHREALRGLVNRTATPVRLVLLIGALGLFWSIFRSWSNVGDGWPWGEPLVVLGAAGLIVMCLSLRGLRSMLETRVPEYLGRISYSLYLTHATVLFALTNLLYGKTSLGSLLVLYVLLSFGVGHLFCLGIEEPSLRLGKRLGLRLA